MDDGVTIAKDIELENPFENMGAQLAREVASKTNDVAGDGTTTAICLTQSLLPEGIKNIAAGANPNAIERGIEKGRGAEAVKSIKALAKEVDDKAEISQVASIRPPTPRSVRSFLTPSTRSAKKAL